NQGRSERPVGRLLLENAMASSLTSIRLPRVGKRSKHSRKLMQWRGNNDHCSKSLGDGLYARARAHRLQKQGSQGAVRRRRHGGEPTGHGISGAVRDPAERAARGRARRREAARRPDGSAADTGSDRRDHLLDGYKRDKPGPARPDPGRERQGKEIRLPYREGSPGAQG